MPAGAGALAACKRLEVQVMWRFLTTATILVILLAGSHASPAVAAKAANPHHYQTFRGKVVAPLSSGWSLSALPSEADIRWRIEHV